MQDKGSDRRNLPGEALIGWQAPPMPAAVRLEGTVVSLEPLSADLHAAELFAAFAGHDQLWDYMFDGPFADAEEYHRWAKGAEGKADPAFLVLRERATGRLAGVAAYMRIAPQAGTIEVGSICIAPTFQRSRLFTEAMWLMMDHAFRLGYRRYEWKCNALNLPSRRAAQRLGFSYEGIFRQHMVVKGRSRDTAWFAVIDQDWPELNRAFTGWLDPANFDRSGQQRQQLSDLTRAVRVASDPALGAEGAG